MTPRQSNDASSESRRTEVVNRATGAPFLVDPMQASLLRVLLSCLTLNFHFSSLHPFLASLLFCFVAISTHPPTHPIVPPQPPSPSLKQHPCQTASAASDTAVPSRSEEAENDRAGDTGIGRGWGGWLLSPWQPSVFVSARESDKR